MIRRCALVTCLAAALGLVGVVPAGAAPVLINPVIGVRGFQVASVPLGTTSFQTMTGCEEFLGLGAGTLCVPYLITPSYSGGVFSVDLTFRNTFGDVSPIDASQLVLSAKSDFTRMEQIDPFTVRLSGGNGSMGEMLCGNLSKDFYNNPSVYTCTPGYDVVVFLGGTTGEPLPKGPYDVAMTAVNVPEPATLALMGIGAILTGRSLRRRQA